eukprot:6484252-Amphidinium_carterae.1
MWSCSLRREGAKIGCGPHCSEENCSERRRATERGLQREMKNSMVVLSHSRGERGAGTMMLLKA